MVPVKTGKHIFIANLEANKFNVTNLFQFSGDESNYIQLSSKNNIKFKSANQLNLIQNFKLIRWLKSSFLLKMFCKLNEESFPEISHKAIQTKIWNHFNPIWLGEISYPTQTLWSNKYWRFKKIIRHILALQSMLEVAT